MMDRKYRSLLSLSPHCVFLRFCDNVSHTDERKLKAFPFESISCLSAARFMTSSEKSFWVVVGMTFWPWKK